MDNVSSSLNQVDQLVLAACQFQHNRVALYDHRNQLVHSAGADMHSYLINEQMVNLTDRVAMMAHAFIGDMDLVPKPKEAISLGGTIPPKYTDLAKLSLYYNYGFSHYTTFPSCMIYVTLQQRRHGLLQTICYFVARTKTRVIVIHNPVVSYDVIQPSITQLLEQYPHY